MTLPSIRGEGPILRHPPSPRTGGLPVSGRRRRIFLPPELGFGERAPAQVGPDGALIFDIELAAVEPRDRAPAGRDRRRQLPRPGHPLPAQDPGVDILSARGLLPSRRGRIPGGRAVLTGITAAET